MTATAERLLEEGERMTRNTLTFGPRYCAVITPLPGGGVPSLRVSLPRESAQAARAAGWHDEIQNMIGAARARLDAGQVESARRWAVAADALAAACDLDADDQR